MYGLWLFKELRTEYGHCKVEVFRKGYTASAVEIGGFVGNSLNLALENLDTITAPIGKSVCSFSIYDTEQVEYDDLFTPDATAYKVVVSTKVDGGEYNTRWSGYVTPDFFAENLSFRTPISISARDNIGYLNDVDFDLDTATITVRELIQAAFNRIAEDYPMSLSFVTQKQTEEGILAIDATISTYLLREMSWYEALETVLHDLGLQMRWVDNNTIAVLDISQLGENFGIQRFNFIERSGYREILPAWRELSQKQDYGLIENFFRGRISEENLTFVKEEQVVIDGYNTSTMRYYSPKNWLGNGLTINYNDYFFSVGGVMSESERNRIYFTGISKDTTAYINKFIGWRQPVYKSNNAMKVSFKALNSIQVVSQYSLQGMPTLQTFGPYPPGIAQFGLKVNVLLHTATKTYIMRYKWEELNADETDAINFVLPVLQGNANEEECVIDLGNIPYDGELELRIYGWYFIEATNWTSMPLNAVSYITDVVYTYDGSATGQDAKVVVAELHNIKGDRDYSFGQVPLDSGGINAYAGGLFKANGDELVGFKRNADGSTYPLLELVGREIIHFNKKNYNKLSGTIKNLAKEPLRFDKVFIYKGKNYLPFACSLDVISNTMNITTMQEVEPYMTYSFVEIKSELVTGGGATISGGNNTALQYSAEVGNAKRISELNNASESEKKEAYVVIDNVSWPESKKVPFFDIVGLNEAQVGAYLTENKYATQSWVAEQKYAKAADVTSLSTSIANIGTRVTTTEGKISTLETILKTEQGHIDTLQGYFNNGVAKDAAKLGGQLPNYYATASGLTATNTALSALTTRVTTAEGNISKNATAITAVSKRVADLEAMWYIDDNGNLHTTYNIVSDKDVVAGGEYSGGSGGGGSTGLGTVTIKTVSGQEYKTDSNGVVTIPDYQPKGNYLTGITSIMVTTALGYVPFNSTSFTKTTIKNTLGIADWALAASKPSYSWSEITGKPTFATVATSGKYSDLSGVPTSLPASDVYAWAKKASLAASDVPNLDWSKITSGKPTTLSGYGITDALSTSGGTITSTNVAPLSIKRNGTGGAFISFENNNGRKGYIGITNSSELFFYSGDQIEAASRILHEGNYSAYALPKNGGSIKGSRSDTLYVDTSNETQNNIFIQCKSAAKTYIGWSSSNGSYICNYASSGRLGIKDDGTPYFGANTLVHSGNYTSFSPTRYSSVGANNMPIGAAIGYTYTTEEHGGKYTGGVINFGADNYYAQLNGGIGEYKLAYRYKYGTDGFSEWRDIAFTNSNVASSTKLQTARTIWGQSFDGRANVSGDVILSEKTRINTTHLVFQEPDTGGWARGVRFTNTAGTVIGEIGGVGTVTDGLSYCYIAAGNYASNKALRVYSDGTIMSYTIQPLANLEYNLGSPTNSWGRVFTRYIDTLSGYDLRFCAGGTEFMKLTASNGDLHLINGGLVVNGGFKITASSLNIFEHTAGGLHIGYGLTGNYITQLYGGSGVYLRYGADRSYGLTIGSGGHTKVHKSFEVAEGLNVGKSIVVGEGLYMNNNQYMYCKDSNNAYVSTLYINNSNLLAIGYGTVAKGYSTAIYGGGGVNLRYGTSGSNGLTINSEGYTKVFKSFEVAGNTYLSADVTITGQITASGDGVFGSDARYKSKLQDLAVDVETIANAPVFSYKWTDRADDKVHLGTTAQYWLPTKFCDAVDTSNKDFYHLNYGALGVAIGVMVAKKVVNHEERILALERENKALKNELKQLRQWHN